MIKVGDIVKVNDWGKAYSTYSKWFERWKSVLKYEWAVHYAYGDKSKYFANRHDDCLYCVLFVNDQTDAVLIGDGASKDYKVYLVNISGLEKQYSKRMTKTQIEKELGYKIEIIEEDEE